MSLIKKTEAAKSSLSLLKPTNHLLDPKLSKPPSSDWKSAIRYNYKPKWEVLKQLQEYHNRPPRYFTRLKIRILRLLRIPEKEEFFLTRFHNHKVVPDDGVHKFYITNLFILTFTSWFFFVIGYKYAQLKYDFYSRRYHYGRSTSFMIIFDFLHERYEERMKRKFIAIKEAFTNPMKTIKVVWETYKEKREMYKLLENEIVDTQLEKEGSDFQKLIVTAAKLKEEK